MRIRCWVRAISSRCTELTSSSCSRARSRSAAADGEQLLLAVRRGSASTAVRCLGGAVDRHLEPGQHHGHGDADGLGGAALADQPLAPLDGPGPGLALRLGRPDAASRRGRAAHGRAPRWCAARAGRPSPPARAARAASASRSRSVVSGSSSVASWAAASRASRSASPARSWSRASVGRGDRRGDPLGLAAGRARGACRSGRAPRPRRPASRRTRGAWRAPRRPGAGRRAARCRAGRCRSRAARRRRSPRPSWAEASSYAAWISSRLGCEAEPPAAKWAPKHVAVAGHGGDVGQVGDQGAGGVEVVDHGGLEEQARQRRAQGVGARHHVDGVRRVAGQPGPGARSSVDSPAEQQPGPAEVAGLEVADRRRRRRRRR